MRGSPQDVCREPIVSGAETDRSGETSLRAVLFAMRGGERVLREERSGEEECGRSHQSPDREGWGPFG